MWSRIRTLKGTCSAAAPFSDICDPCRVKPRQHAFNDWYPAAFRTDSLERHLQFFQVRGRVVYVFWRIHDTIHDSLDPLLPFRGYATTPYMDGPLPEATTTALTPADVFTTVNYNNKSTTTTSLLQLQSTATITNQGASALRCLPQASSSDSDGDTDDGHIQDANR